MSRRVRVVSKTPKWGISLNPYGNGGFVKRSGQIFDVHSPDKTWSYRSAETNRGIDLHEVRPGDYWQGDHQNPLDPEKNRSEINSRTTAPFDTDVWFSYARRLSVPGNTGFTNDGTNAWCVLDQWRAMDDVNDYAGRSPVLAFEAYRIAGGSTTNVYGQIVTRSDPSDPSTSGSQVSVVRWGQPTYALNVWHYHVCRVRFSKTGNGLLDYWLDGVKIINNLVAPIGSNDALGPQWNYGIYRSAHSTNSLISEVANPEIEFTKSLTSRVLYPLTLPVGS